MPKGGAAIDLTHGVGADGDVDLLRERAASAEGRLRAQTMLVAQAEHKLRTAMTLVQGWASTLDRRWDDMSADERRQGITSIRRCAEGAVAQAERMLEAAGAELASLDVEPQVLDLTEVLGLTVGNHRGLSERHRIVLRATAPVPALVDPAALQQVIGHLLENAVKYSPDGGTITVSVRSAEGGAEIEVADEGIGLPEGVDVFAPFQRGDRTSPGVGLGLYIVRNLIEAMGGVVRGRRNDRPGSVFTVRLPAR